MKHRPLSKTSNLAQAGKRRRTWPKFGQRPFPPHSQPNGAQGNPLMGENLAAMPPGQMQPQDKQEMAALQMQEAEKMQQEELAVTSEAETLQTQEAEDEVMKKEEEELAATSEAETVQKKEAEDEVMKKEQEEIQTKETEDGEAQNV